MVVEVDAAGVQRRSLRGLLFGAVEGWPPGKCQSQGGGRVKLRDAAAAFYEAGWHDEFNAIVDLVVEHSLSYKGELSPYTDRGREWPSEWP